MNKYGATKSIHNGIVYHSKKERDYAQELDLRIRARDIADWQRQIRIPLVCNGIKICDYTIDFIIRHNDASDEYIEVKGFETAVWKLKWKLFCANYPDWKKTIVK